ncbi:trypsin Inhibitor like cysteine rich domain protein [Ancylostoma caninum]|uniref:Trypsin Inhibitor like cysteine rich domain protein n=1 Tax=Ancylostoma caninum TaxID=29170 RepID=A0A368GL67_ANCCA|nr:trypsin Inhibitor like cysteine rich domain protein [Ancylostoma caninum]
MLRLFFHSEFFLVLIFVALAIAKSDGSKLPKCPGGCLSGFHCEVIDGVPQCVVDPGPCAAVRCGFNTTCFEFNGKAACCNTTCSAGEVFSECSSYCEPTCEPPTMACIQSCGPPACQCRTGYVRDNGKCVDPKTCSNNEQSGQSYVDEPITPPTPSCKPQCLRGFHCVQLNGNPACVTDKGK